MEKSEQINELATALALAQGAMSPVKKDAQNPHLKNSYATLDSVIATIKKPLSKNGLAYSQLVGRDGETTTLTTILMHSESGQYLSTTTSVARLTGNRATNDMQTLGAALTYMKRYQLSAILGLSTEEDGDGSGSGNQKRSRKPKNKPASSPPKPSPTRAKLEKRWDDLWHQAIALSLNPDDLPATGPDDTNAELTAAGKKLAALVEAAAAKKGKAQ